MPGQILRFLEDYERHAGAGTVRRVIVMDRESHAVSLFKALDPTWGFVVPLRSQVTGPSAKFEEVGPWGPFGEGPDEVCDALLTLNDSRPGEQALRIRVVGRRRHRTGKVAWYATNLPVDEFAATQVIRIYFERWPAQEQVYRDGSGAVGLDVHHGYGKKKVDSVAIVDRQDKLLGQVRRIEADLVRQRARLEELREERAHFQAALDHAAPQIRGERDVFDVAITKSKMTEALRASHASLRRWEAWVETTRAKTEGLTRETAKAQDAITTAELVRAQKLAEIERLAGSRRIFTVDVELDEIMTAYKLTFMNLCGLLMSKYLGVNLEIETLIDAVLTLPGERVTTGTTETIRIFRSPRDARVMAAVERACAALTTRGLRRGNRTVSFEVVDPPARRRRADPTEP